MYRGHSDLGYDELENVRVNMPKQRKVEAAGAELTGAIGLITSQSSSQYSFALQEALRSKKRSQGLI